jgi:hypothetical protein
MKTIYTVIIKNTQGDLSTASFLKFDSAVDYCVSEILQYDEELEENPDKQDKIMRELEDQMYYVSEFGDTYWIEEATLSK